MKHLNVNRQWLLCAALIMALGSQSYFQVSSNNLSSVDMSSIGDTPEAIAEAQKITEDSGKEKKAYEVSQLAEAESKIEAKVLDSKAAEKSKPDDLKLYDFYKSYEFSKMAEARASKDTKVKELKTKQAKASAAKAEKLTAKVVSENKDRAEDVALYQVYKSYELKKMTEAKEETDKEAKELKLKHAAEYKGKSDSIASTLKKSATDPRLKKYEHVDFSELIDALEEKKAREAAAKSAKMKTEGTASKVELCEGGCTPTEKVIAEAMKIIDETQKTKAAKEIENETPKERRERLAQERKDAKDQKDEAKKLKAEDIAEKKREKAEELRAKKLEEKEARNEEFTLKMEAVSESCKEDIECASSRLTSLLSSYSGDKKVDTSVVNQAFNQYISKNLRAALKNPENAQLVSEALYQISSEVPSEYRFLKEKTIDLVRNEAISKAAEVNRNFKMAEQLTKANKPVEANQYFNAGMMGGNEFVRESNYLTSSIAGGLNSAQDRITMEYINRKYLPDMKKLELSLMNTDGTDLGKLGDSTISDTSTNRSGSTATSVSTRNSRGGTSSSGNTVTTTNTRGKTNILESSGVQFGNPTATPRGDRRSN